MKYIRLAREHLRFASKEYASTPFKVELAITEINIFIFV